MGSCRWKQKKWHIRTRLSGNRPRKKKHASFQGDEHDTKITSSATNIPYLKCAYSDDSKKVYELEYIKGTHIHRSLTPSHSYICVYSPLQLKKRKRKKVKNTKIMQTDFPY